MGQGGRRSEDVRRLLMVCWWVRREEDGMGWDKEWRMVVVGIQEGV